MLDLYEMLFRPANISACGTKIVLRASHTFKYGLPITKFPDDADPLEFPETSVANGLVDLNGKMFAHSVAEPIKVNISVIPNSQDDVNLGILLRANRPAATSVPAMDSIVMVVVYPDFTVKMFKEGIITAGPGAASINSAGRLSAGTYSFLFADSIHTSISASKILTASI